MKATVIRCLLLGCLLAALVGCDGGATRQNDDGPRTYRIAVIPKGTSHEFWDSVHAGVERAAAEFDRVEVTWKGPQSEGDTDQQIELVENFIADQYDGICLAPSDATALRAPVEEAIRNQVPVVIFDSGLSSHEGIVSYVATNNYRGGQVAARYLAELLGESGDVILMRYELGSQSTELREQGFLDAIAAYKGINPLSVDKFAGPSEADAIRLAEDLLSNYRNEVDGIFCPNQSTASGMLTVLTRQFPDLVGKVKFVGFDSGPNIVQGLRDARINGTILQDPVQMGYDAVRVMFEHLEGQQVPEVIETQETLATVENANEPKIRRLLEPTAGE